MSSSSAGQAPGPGSLRGVLPRVLLILTATTGIIDAVSYLGLGRVFSANMTGNIVLLGFGIAGTGGLPVLAPLISAAAFLLGAAAGGVLARKAERRRTQVSAALAIEVALVAVAAGLAAVVHIRAGHASGDAVIALLALGMGVRNATVRGLGVPDMTTTVLTMTLTALSADSRPAGGTGKGTVRRTAAVMAMLLGAIAGALAIKTSLILALVLAAALGLVALAGFARYGSAA
jgi:uncharacterized membrane protein YoaK (UPF0700 family)